MNERRHEGDRRAESPGSPAPSERRGATRASSTLVNVLRSIGGILVLIGVIIFTVRSMRPVYATRGTLGDELRKHAPGVAGAIGAGDSTNLDRLMATEKFREEKQNFYEDVMRLKQVDSARADSIAQYAVREAYVRGISPAIIFGVMLTENSRFVSKAKSNVGAVGLMQVYPKVWLTKEMSALFGRDLASDSTNVKYGVFILSQYFNPRKKGGGTKTENWATALLHYNGCVKGTNTPRCHTYPDKVQNFVEGKATSICNGRSFYDCIAKPFIEGLFEGGKLAADEPKPAADSSAAPGAVAAAAGATVTQSAGTVALPPALTLPPVLAAPPAASDTVSRPENTGAGEKADSSGTVEKSATKAPARKATPKKSSSRKSSARTSKTKRSSRRKS